MIFHAFLLSRATDKFNVLEINPSKVQNNIMNYVLLPLTTCILTEGY